MDNPTSRIEHKITWFIVALAVIGLVIIGTRVVNSDIKDNIPVSIGTKTFRADLAVTDHDRQKGLGGTDELSHSEALLMVFEHEDKWSIWMKDVDYPIDIVWINDNKQVVDSVKSAQPDSYPSKYVPRRDARYVLELPEGSIKQYGINVGSSIKFDVSGVAVK